MRMCDLTNVANHYGLKHQLVKCKEELGELIEAIDSANDEAIIEEGNSRCRDHDLSVKATYVC